MCLLKSPKSSGQRNSHPLVTHFLNCYSKLPSLSEIPEYFLHDAVNLFHTFFNKLLYRHHLCVEQPQADCLDYETHSTVIPCAFHTLESASGAILTQAHTTIPRNESALEPKSDGAP